MLDKISEPIGKAFVFDKIRPGLRNYFMKAGIVDVPYSLFGKLFWLSIVPVALVFMLFGWNYILSLQKGVLVEFLLALILWLGVHAVVLSFMILALYFYLDLKIFNRTKKMEEVLPGFLSMVSENIKGGMPFESALWSAIRPEFDVLSNEISLAAKKVMTGQDVDDALRSFTEKYDSPIMKRSFELIIEGIKGGGRIVDVIDEVIKNIEETNELKSDMVATNLSYVIFIIIIVLFVAPGLFTLSFQFLTVLQGISERVGIATAGTDSGVNLPVSFGNIAAEPAVFQAFSINALLIISFFASLMISIIQRGSIRAGIRYVPILMIGSHLMYRLMMLAATSVFSGFVV